MVPEIREGESVTAFTLRLMRNEILEEAANIAARYAEDDPLIVGAIVAAIRRARDLRPNDPTPFVNDGHMG